MSTIKRLSVFLLANLFYIVANAVPDPSKYTVTFKYNDEVNWCLGGIIGEDTVVTSGDCFAIKDGTFINYTSLKAVIGSNELDVQKVILFEFPKSKKNVSYIENRAVHDFALVKLKQSFNLAQNGLIALSLANSNHKINENTVVFVSNEENHKAEQVKVTHETDCSLLKMLDDEIAFFNESQLCVELSNDEDSCYHEPGSPLVDEGNKLIGIYLDCYDESPYEIFAKISYFGELIEEASKANLDEDGKFGSFVVKNYS